MLREVALPLFLGAMRLATILLLQNNRNSFTSAVEDPGVRKMQKERLLSVVGLNRQLTLYKVDTDIGIFWRISPRFLMYTWYITVVSSFRD